jgi:hypothetical protein
MSSTSGEDFEFTDAFVYLVLLPFGICVVSCGFCIVYRRWFDKPIFGSDFTVREEVDPGRPSSGNSPYSVETKKRMGSWEV